MFFSLNLNNYCAFCIVMFWDKLSLPLLFLFMSNGLNIVFYLLGGSVTSY